jgi:hypothetical protein
MFFGGSKTAERPLCESRRLVEKGLSHEQRNEQTVG